MWIHIKMVHDTSFFTCGQCDRRTKTEEALSFHIQMRHTESTIKMTKNSENTSENTVPSASNTNDNIKSIRSKYLISKTIDGLEKIPIVTQNLTSKQVFMMEE